MSARREQLLDIAEALLEREGLESFGVNGLAREAGIRPPSLYKHFAGIAEIEHALIARCFRMLATVLDKAERLQDFMVAYRGVARDHPQLYRLMTERPLDRELLDRLDPGAEIAAMAALLRVFGENNEDHTMARVAWAAAHGLVSLENAGRFPPGADVDDAWSVLVETLEPGA